jgi:Flp pilus assembly pilin Flp
MGAIFLLGPKISNMFNNVGTQLDSAAPAAEG